MKQKISFTIILIFIIFIPSFSQNFFTTKGKEIIGPDGKPFLIKGTNIGNWLVPEGYMFKFSNASSPRLITEVVTELIGPDAAKMFWKKFLDSYITADDIHYIKSIGINSIRIPFNYRLFTNENYMGDNDASRGFIYLDKIINWCRAENLYVILDMHCAPGGQTGDNIDDSYGYPFLFENSVSRAQCASIWKKIAAHYKNEKLIIGYDLLNEPIAHYFDKIKLNPLLEPVYKQIADSIRQVDTNHILILGGAQWDSDFSPFGPPFDSKLVYTFHKYWTAPDKEVIQSYIDFRDKYNVPIYCGETGENNNEWIAAFRKTLDENNIGWHYWPYKKMNDNRGIITFPVPANYDSVIVYANAMRNSFDEIRKAKPADIKLLQKALDDFIENCRFKNCVPNEEYIKALGFIY